MIGRGHLDMRVAVPCDTNWRTIEGTATDGGFTAGSGLHDAPLAAAQRGRG